MPLHPRRRRAPGAGRVAAGGGLGAAAVRARGAGTPCDWACTSRRRKRRRRRCCNRCRRGGGWRPRTCRRCTAPQERNRWGRRMPPARSYRRPCRRTSQRCPVRAYRRTGSRRRCHRSGRACPRPHCSRRASCLGRHSSSRARTTAHCSHDRTRSASTSRPRQRTCHARCRSRPCWRMGPLCSAGPCMVGGTGRRAAMRASHPLGSARCTCRERRTGRRRRRHSRAHSRRRPRTLAAPARSPRCSRLGACLGVRCTPHAPTLPT